MRSHAGPRQALRSAEYRRQGRHRQGPIQGDSRATTGPARGRCRTRHRARHRPRRIVEVLPGHHAVREGPEILGGEFRSDAALDALVADRQGYLRHDDATHCHRPVREQDAARAGRIFTGTAGDVDQWVDVARKVAKATRSPRWLSIAAVIVLRAPPSAWGRSISMPRAISSSTTVTRDGQKTLRLEP